MPKTSDIPVSAARQHDQPPTSYFVPVTDIYETSDDLVIVADLPGIKAEGLTVTVEDNVLEIRGSQPAPEKAPGEALLQEFASGEFFRAFQLPADFDTDKIQATLKQGVLTVRLPKSERLKPRRVEVKAE
jgi:HSP20 family protein